MVSDKLRRITPFQSVGGFRADGLCGARIANRMSSAGRAPMVLDFNMDRELTRAEVDSMSGITVLEFGANWCPICKGARPMIDRALTRHAAARHVWVEDGKGKRLGRSFRVKLWPTLPWICRGRSVSVPAKPPKR